MLSSDLPQAWLIDLDGTLVDTLGDFHAAWSRVAAQLGLDAPPASAIAPLIGRGGERLVRDLLALAGRGEADFEAAWPLYRAAYAEVNGRHGQPYAGVVPALEALAASGLLACVTNKPQAQAEALLAHFGLRGHFRAVVGARPGLRPKPQPDAFLAGAEALGVAPTQCGAIGDSRNDFEAARAAGCQPVLLLRHGYNHGEPIEAVPADVHLDGWPALTRWLSDRPCRAVGP